MRRLSHAIGRPGHVRHDAEQHRPAPLPGDPGRGPRPPRPPATRSSPRSPVAPSGLLFGLDTTYHPFAGRPTYAALAGLPPAEKLAASARPGGARGDPRRDRRPGAPSLLERMADRIWPFTDAVDYEPPLEDSVGHLAARTGTHAGRGALRHDRRGLARRPVHDPGQQLRGQHLRRAARDARRTRTPCSACPTVARTARSSATPASRPRCSRTGPATGPGARSCRSNSWSSARPATPPSSTACATAGLLAPGYKADVNVIDYDNLALHKPEMAYDLPGWRPAAGPAGRRLRRDDRQRRGRAPRRGRHRRAAGSYPARRARGTPHRPGTTRRRHHQRPAGGNEHDHDVLALRSVRLRPRALDALLLRRSRLRADDHLRGGRRVRGHVRGAGRHRAVSQFIARDGVSIELLHYTKGSVVGAPSAARNQLGLTHLSLNVDDVDEVAAKLVACGGTRDRVDPQQDRQPRRLGERLRVRRRPRRHPRRAHEARGLTPAAASLRELRRERAQAVAAQRAAHRVRVERVVEVDERDPGRGIGPCDLGVGAGVAERRR